MDEFIPECWAHNIVVGRGRQPLISIDNVDIWVPLRVGIDSEKDRTVIARRLYKVVLEVPLGNGGMEGKVWW